MEQYFEMVEKLLSKYPLSWQKNYYENKLDLVIEHKNQEIKVFLLIMTMKKTLLPFMGITMLL